MSSSLPQYMRDKDAFLSIEDCSDSVEPLYLPQLIRNASNKRVDAMFTIPEKSTNAKGCYGSAGDMASSHLQNLLLKQTIDPVHKKNPLHPNVASVGLKEDGKMEIYQEESNL